MDDIKQFEPLWGVWKVETLIGEGSYGKVYRAVREEFGRKYYAAIKHISIPASKAQIDEAISEGIENDRETVKEYFNAITQTLINEIAFMNDVKGKTNIVSYEDHLIIPKSSGIGYDIIIRMELLTCLNDILRHKQFTNKDVIKLGIDICSALEVCVKKEIIHRDIKPSNIFVSDSGDFKLGDFGVARELQKTSAMSKKGTYVYMAPEVYRGESANFSADIFSLGIVMYRLLNGNRAPFLPVSAKIKPGDNENALARRMSGEQIPAPAFAEEGLAQIILKATQFDRTKRYASPTEMKNALIRLSGGTVLERTVPIIAEPTHNSVSFQQRNAPANQQTVILFPQQDASNRQASNAARSSQVSYARQTPVYNTVAQQTNGTVYSRPAFVNRPMQNPQVNYHVNAEEKDKTPIHITIGAVSGLLIIILIIVVFSVARGTRYNSYIEQYNSGDYESARSGFESMGNYMQCEEYVLMCDYNIAKNEIDNGNHDNALSILERLDGYSDSSELINEANYKKATMLLSSKEFDDAKSLFSDLGYYSDSKNMVKECDYQKAIYYYENSFYENALSEFKSLSQYKKSAEYVALCDFHIAKYSISYADIEKLTTVMNGLLKYANSNLECKNCCADSLFTIMKLYNSTFSYSGLRFKFYHEKDDSSLWMTNSYDFWDSYNQKHWGFNENKGQYGLITFTRSEDGPYIDWIEIVDFDDPYTDKPSTVTVKNPNDGKEYTLKRQK